MIGRLIEPLGSVLSLFYPPLCAVCQTSVSPTEQICASCLAKAQRIRPPFCGKCSEPFSGDIGQQFTCANCAHRELDFDAAIAAYRSRGVVRFAILQLKYSRQLSLRYPVGEWLMEGANDSRLRNRGFDLIVPVPLHPARLRERGFNQAETLASQLQYRMQIPMHSVLTRIRYTTTQTALDRVERMENLRDAFRLRKNKPVRGLHVLLVDDILTTGSTLSECARVLREAGAQSVYALTAARA